MADRATSSATTDEAAQQSHLDMVSSDNPAKANSASHRRRSKNKPFAHFKIRSHSVSQETTKYNLQHTGLPTKLSGASDHGTSSRVASDSSEPGSITSTFSHKKRHSILNLRKKKVQETEPASVKTVSDEQKQKFGGGIFKKAVKPAISVPTTTADDIPIKNHDDERPTPSRPQFDVPLISIDEDSTLKETKVRPSYHRSISFQSKNEHDGRSIISHVSSKSSSSEAQRIISSEEYSENRTPQETPKRLRQRSKTAGAADYSTTPLKIGNDPHNPVPEFSSPVTGSPYGGFGNTQAPKPVTSRFSTLTNFVKSRRSSSILALDEIAKMPELQSTPGSSASERAEFSHIVNSSHNTLATASSSSDYFGKNSKTSPSIGHKSTNSTISIENYSILAPRESEAPSAYINRLINSNNVTEILPLISQKESDFNNECLDYFIKFFDFFNEPLDVSLRKFLTFNELPKETQQIDRVLYKFSKEYCQQNPSTTFSEDACFILAFSLLILHTDHFNPNNKRKMTKLQFVRIVKESLQTHLEATPEAEKDDVEFSVKNIVTRDILGYYFDNITFTPIKRLDECSKENLLKANGNKGASYLSVDVVDPAASADSELDSCTPRMILKTSLSTSSITPGGPRRRQSSFFSPASAGSEGIYEYMLGLKDIEELRFRYDFQKNNPFVNMLDEPKSSQVKLPYASVEDNILTDTEDRIDEIDPKIFMQLMDNVTSSTPEIVLKLKAARASAIKDNCKVDIIGTDEEYASTFYTRVIKMGTVYRQEAKKLTSSTSWKPYFAVLTSVGLKFYKDINSLKIKTVDFADRQITILDEQLNTGFFETSVDAGFMIYIHGLFANRSASGAIKKQSSALYSQLESFQFTIYGKNSRDTYSLTSQDALMEWVFSINYLVALKDCYLVPEPQKIDFPEEGSFGEMRPAASLTLLQKVNKSNKVLTSSLDLLKRLFGVCNNFELLTPFNNKTRELTTYSAQLLNTRISWCWYELNKNLVIVKVLLYAINEQEGVDLDDQVSVVTKDMIHSPSFNGNILSSLHREKTAASVAAVMDYNIDSSMHMQSTDQLTPSSPDSESFETLFYDCST